MVASSLLSSAEASRLIGQIQASIVQLTTYLTRKVYDIRDARNAKDIYWKKNNAIFTI